MLSKIKIGDPVVKLIHIGKKRTAHLTKVSSLLPGITSRAYPVRWKISCEDEDPNFSPTQYDSLNGMEVGRKFPHLRVWSQIVPLGK